MSEAVVSKGAFPDKIAGTNIKLCGYRDLAIVNFFNVKALVYCGSVLVSKSFTVSKDKISESELMDRYTPCSITPRFCRSGGAYLKTKTGAEFYFGEIQTAITAIFILHSHQYFVSECMCFLIRKNGEMHIELTGSHFDLSMFIGMIKAGPHDPFKNVLVRNSTMNDISLRILEIDSLRGICENLNMCALMKKCMHESECPFGYKKDSSSSSYNAPEVTYFTGDKRRAYSDSDDKESDPKKQKTPTEKPVVQVD